MLSTAFSMPRADCIETDIVIRLVAPFLACHELVVLGALLINADDLLPQGFIGDLLAEMLPFAAALHLEIHIGIDEQL